MMGLRVIYIFTHDSRGVGEDAPTHQPVEHLAGLRSVPNLVMIRPADAAETAQAWKVAIERANGPTALILSRQGLPVLDRSTMAPAEGLLRGAYTLWESSISPQVIFIGTGSETHIALQAGYQLKERGIESRVVSMPSWELFEDQSQEYRDSVLPPTVMARIAIEAGSPFGWERYVGLSGVIVGIDRFGASAPMKTIYEKLGITAEKAVEAAIKLAENN